MPQFLEKILEDINRFCGVIGTPILYFWWRLPWDSKSGWIPYLHASLPACKGFFRFTSGATPADLLTSQNISLEK